MSRRFSAAAIVALVSLASLRAARSVAIAQADAPLVCVALTRAEAPFGGDVSAPLRDALVAGLRSAGSHAIALDSGDNNALLEGAQKNCASVILTRVQTRGGGGLMQKMSNLRPKIGGQSGQRSEGADAGGSPAAAPTLAGAQAILKRGDVVSLEYRSTAVRSKAVKSGKLDGKAQADGEDVLGPLVAQLSTVVMSAAAAVESSADRRGPRSGSANTVPPQTMNCEQMAAASHGSVTVEACKQMMGLQQAYTSAASDPSASRPGDDTMTCDQIAAELKQQSIAPPDAAKTAEANAAITDLQQGIAKAQKEGTELVMKESAEASVASRLAVTNQMAAAQAEKIQREQKELNERLAKENTPKAERAFSAFADMMSDAGKQLSTNPRLGRLIQLATQKGCKLQ